MIEEPARIDEFDRILEDAHIAVARRPEFMRACDVKVKPLPPRLWERLRQQLQAEYRRATGEQHAVLVVTDGEPT